LTDLPEDDPAMRMLTDGVVAVREVLKDLESFRVAHERWILFRAARPRAFLPNGKERFFLGWKCKSEDPILVVTVNPWIQNIIST
jgi:hypothetical protein